MLFVRPFYLLSLIAPHVFAQRPVLLTESPFTSGIYKVDLYIAAEYLKKQTAPFSNVAESLTRVAIVGWHQGVAENVNLDLDWRGYLFAALRNGSRVNDWGDLTISTRIRFLSERRTTPALGFRTSVKLPNTKYFPNGLGSNQTDYFAHLLFAKHFGTVETRLNAGLGIIGDPKTISAQDDLYMLSAAVIVPANSWLSLFAELHGFDGYLDHDGKLLSRFGASASFSGFEWNIFGSARLAGSNVDVAGAFEASETWSVGFAVKKTFELSFLKSDESEK